MIIEFTLRWPFVRCHICVVRAAVATGQSIHGTPDHAHRSWVRTKHGIGWLHHHEPDGYVVEFEDGRLIKTPILEHVSKP